MSQKRTIPFDFDNGRGDKLSGLLDLPAKETPDFYGVFAPCFTCIKESHGAFKICRAMADLGAAMLRFDMTGLGKSEGDFSQLNFSKRIEDITAAVLALEAAYGPVTLLAGHSISGTAALHAQASLPHLTTVATIGSPDSAVTTIEKFRAQNLIEEFDDKVVIDVLGQPYTFDKDFPQDLLNQKVPPFARDRLLVFHAPNDKIVAYENAARIAARAPEKAELITLSDTATHLFERGTEDAALVAQHLYNKTKR